MVVPSALIQIYSLRNFGFPPRSSCRTPSCNKPRFSGFVVTGFFLPQFLLEILEKLLVSLFLSLCSVLLGGVLLELREL